MSNQNQSCVDSFRSPSGEQTHTGAGNAGTVGANLGHQRPTQAPDEPAQLIAERQRMYDHTRQQNDSNR